MREGYYQQVKAFISKDWEVPLPETCKDFISQIGGKLTDHAMYVAG
jgi:hypothetical protein